MQGRVDIRKSPDVTEAASELVQQPPAAPGQPLVAAQMQQLPDPTATSLAMKLSFLQGKRVKVDIGTLGDPIPSPDNPLITFDPFDSELIDVGKGIARLPYLVVGESAPKTLQPTFATVFHVNEDFPACSSANEFDYNRTLPDSFPEWLKHCYQPKTKKSRAVSAVRLSKVLSEAGVSSIEFLKIDAQGSDSDIVRDVFENTKIPVHRLQIECQEYANAKGVVEYTGVDNDCDKTKHYLESKFPGLQRTRYPDDPLCPPQLPLIWEFNDCYQFPVR